MRKEIKTIIQSLKDGKLNRSIDEKGAGGFWDLAGEIGQDAQGYVNGELQEDIYYALYDVAEVCLEKDFN